ncbi:MAG TPA: CAP domain-containing protein [Sphingomicrobium sp.]|nr:CAP domain-containing protein [Sphingomicrobium sp.]
MLQGHFVRSFALITTAFALAAPAAAQSGPPLPPLPAGDQALAEINRLEEESARLSQEARELGGGRTIAQAGENVRGDFHEKQARADELDQLARDMGYSEAELRAEQRRIAESGHIGLGDLGKGAAGQVLDKAAEEAIKHATRELYGHAFGVLSFGKDCYDATTRIKLWWMTRQQARSLGDSAQSIHDNWIALNETIIALYGDMALDASKMRRLADIEQRYREIRDRIATLEQRSADLQQRATRHAADRRDEDPGYDRLLDSIARLKFERRIASLKGDDREVRRLDGQIGPLERQAERAERVPGQRIGMAPGPAQQTSVALLDYHNNLRSTEKSPPLKWSDTLKGHAAEWAQVLAKTGELKHSPRDSRPANERENISISPHGANSPMKMAKGWGDEKKLFRPGLFPNVCTSDWSACAHFTQMVWSSTTEVGCAFVEDRRFDALVCRYSPPGNQDNKPVVAAATEVAPATDLLARKPCPVGEATRGRKSG